MRPKVRAARKVFPKQNVTPYPVYINMQNTAYVTECDECGWQSQVTRYDTGE
jgi:hypothetical protein